VLTVAKRETHISLLTKHLEKALENEKAAAITRATAERLMESHHQSVPRACDSDEASVGDLGPPLEIHPISHAGICMCYSDVMGRIYSLPRRLRQALRTEEECVFHDYWGKL
jgi:hypothetical protein